LLIFFVAALSEIGARPLDGAKCRAADDKATNPQQEREGIGAMDDSIERTGGLEAGNPLKKWVHDMQNVLQMITDLGEENARHRSFTESAQREYGKLAAEVNQLRADVNRAAVLAESERRERDALREEVTTLRAENERISREHAEATESAANALGEMKALVNEVANRFSSSTRPSPFAREPRPPRG
jgi:chromosome segregation ATPase